jgi:hypothetical protein
MKNTQFKPTIGTFTLYNVVTARTINEAYCQVEQKLQNPRDTMIEAARHSGIVFLSSPLYPCVYSLNSPHSINDDLGCNSKKLLMGFRAISMQKSAI